MRRFRLLERTATVPARENDKNMIVAITQLVCWPTASGPKLTERPCSQPEHPAPADYPLGSSEPASSSIAETYIRSTCASTRRVVRTDVVPAVKTYASTGTSRLNR